MKVQGEETIRETIRNRTQKQRDIAKSAGVSHTNLNKFVRDDNYSFSYSTLKKLESYLGIECIK